MLIGINQRGKRDRALDRRVELNAKFAQEPEIRTKSGRNDQFIGYDAPPATSSATELETLAIAVNAIQRKSGFDADLPRIYQRRQGQSQFTAGYELVVDATSKCLGGLSPLKTQITSVPAACDLRRVSSIRVPSTEWPAPSTAIVFPA